MKKFFVMPVLFFLLVMFSVGSADAEWLYATDGKTNIRERPDKKSKIVGILHKGEKIWVYSHLEGSSWCQVFFDGNTAYVSDHFSSYEVADDTKYVDVNRGDISDIHSEVNEWTYWDRLFNGEDFFLYETEFDFAVSKETYVYSDYKNGEVIGKLKKGKIVPASKMRISSDGIIWVEVRKDEQKGYILFDHLTIQNGFFPVLSNRMKTITFTNFFSEPDINSKSIRLINFQEVFSIDFFVCTYNEEYEIWAHCIDNSGVEGFISCFDLIAS